MLTKSATPNASRRPAAERSEGAIPIRFADEVSNSNASRRPAAERSEGAVPIRFADERREQVHARKEKARFGVCGATPNKFEKLSSLQTSRGMIHLYCAFCSE